jgi:apolipoprotein N-acyltransferase
MTGEAGVTFLVVLGSVAAAALWTGRARLGAVAAAMAILAAHGIGSLLLARPAPAERTLLVAAVQPSILRAERSEAGSAATLERLIRLTRLAAAGKPDLTAWPETAVEDLSSRPQVARRIEQLTRETGMPLLVGASGLEMLPARDQPGGRALASRNDAYLLWPGRHFGAPYRKMRLVPFGEYLPLAPGGKWPPWLTSDFLPSIPGSYRRPFWLPDGTRLGVLICWENLFPDFVRSWVRDGSRLLVHLTNDNWFGPTGAPRQHNLASVLRAVENGVPVLIASNTGPSQVIDPRGRVLAEESRLFSEGVVAARVPAGEAGTFYTRWGDLFSVLCSATAAAGIASRFLPGPAAKRRGPNTPGQVHRLLLGTVGPR